MREKQYEQIVDFVAESGKEVAEKKRSDMQNSIQVQHEDEGGQAEADFMALMQELFGGASKSPEEEAAFVDENIEFEDNSEEDVLTVLIKFANCKSRREVDLLQIAVEDQLRNKYALISGIHSHMLSIGLMTCWQIPVVPKDLGEMEVHLASGPKFNVIDILNPTPEMEEMIQKWDLDNEETKHIPSTGFCRDSAGELVSETLPAMQSDEPELLGLKLKFYKNRFKELAKALSHRFPMEDEEEFDITTISRMWVEVLIKSNGNPSEDDWKTALASERAEAN